MINKIISIIFNTDSLPIIGGATGAVTQAKKLVSYMPSVDAIISTIVITIIGATVGYLVKIFLDMLFHKIKKLIYKTNGKL